MAFIVSNPGFTLNTQELDAWCLRSLARFKRARYYRQVDALPKNSYGKVLKTELRKTLAAAPGSALAGPSHGRMNVPFRWARNCSGTIDFLTKETT